MEQFIEKKGLTSFQLKWIAIISMFADHVGALLCSREMWLRYVGRLAFPIFCFLLVEGFFHTHDIRRYMIRLGTFAILSEIPFDIAFAGRVMEIRMQNVFFTLFLGVVMIYFLEKSKGYLEKSMIVFFIMWLASFLHTDYGMRGILLVLIFYVFRHYNVLKLTAGICWNFIWGTKIQVFGGFSVIPIALYNGKEGRKMKFFFYMFYPIHLLVLTIIARSI